MKKIILSYTLAILFAVNAVLSAQVKPLFSTMNRDEVEQAIEGYISFLRQYSNLSVQMSSSLGQDRLGKTTNISDTEFKNMCREIYKADMADPRKIYRAVMEDLDKTREEAKNDPNLYSDLHKQTLAAIQSNLMDILEDRLRYNEFILFYNDIIVKAKVISKEHQILETEGGANFKKTILKILIEDEIKANPDIKKNTEIQVSYLDYWLKNDTTNWEVGKSYLFNLQYSLHVKTNDFLLLVITGLKETDGYFPIEDGKLIDKNNFFEQDDVVGWELFKQNIINKIDRTTN